VVKISATLPGLEKAFAAGISSYSQQARSQMLIFGEEKSFSGSKILVVIICLKQFFLETTKFGKHKNLG